MTVLLWKQIQQNFVSLTIIKFVASVIGTEAHPISMFEWEESISDVMAD